MTLFYFELTLNEDEEHVLKAALISMIREWNTDLQKLELDPDYHKDVNEFSMNGFFESHIHHAKSILAKLEEGKIQMSGNNFR